MTTVFLNLTSRMPAKTSPDGTRPRVVAIANVLSGDTLRAGWSAVFCAEEATAGLEPVAFLNRAFCISARKLPLAAGGACEK